MRHANRSRRFKEAFARLPLMARFVVALSALVVAGFGVAVAVIWYGDYGQTHPTPDRVWVRLALFSTVTAGALVRAFKRRWRHPWFWVTFVGVMLVRTTIYVTVLRQLPDPPVALFAVVTTLDMQVWVVVLYRLNDGSADPAR
jgi:hypothetical protein